MTPDQLAAKHLSGRSEVGDVPGVQNDPRIGNLSSSLLNSEDT
jgi:hypothetical protein